MIVVSNTSPLNYLILIEAAPVLPQLYGRVMIPTEVLHELQAHGTPQAARDWAQAAPTWLEVRTAPAHTAEAHLHVGEVAAIALAKELHADLVLMDDRVGREYAQKQGLRVTGVLGVLRDAADQGLIDLEAVLERLHQETNFRAPRSLLDEVLNDFRRNQAP